MRIIAGQFRSRLLQAPRGLDTRPTSDRLRETLFNVLGDRVRGAHVIDLYAGSGAVAIEAMSRGAAGCTVVESAPAAVKAIRANLAALGITAGVQVEPIAVSRSLASLLKLAQKLGVQKAGADIVFLDPPYEAERDYQDTLMFLGQNADVVLREEAVVVAEHGRRHSLLANYGGLHRTRVLEQGDASLSFFAAVRDS